MNQVASEFLLTLCQEIFLIYLLLLLDQGQNLQISLQSNFLALVYIFEFRIDKAKNIVEKCTWVSVIDQVLCEGPDDVASRLQRILAIGGEGLMLRHPTREYRGGRNYDLLKVKFGS